MSPDNIMFPVITSLMIGFLIGGLLVFALIGFGTSTQVCISQEGYDYLVSNYEVKNLIGENVNVSNITIDWGQIPR